MVERLLAGTIGALLALVVSCFIIFGPLFFPFLFVGLLLRLVGMGGDY